MKKAIVPQNASDNLQFYWTLENTTDLFYIYMHFAEVEALQPNQSRSFNIYLNGELLYVFVSPRYLSAFTLYNESPASCNGNSVCRLTISINRTDNSTLPPIINALELYQVIQFTEPETDENDLDAITNIKAMYSVTRNWQGDPCAPKDYVWDGLNCTYDGFSAPRIISLRAEAEFNENNNTLETKNRQFTYSEVLSMTNNFQRVIGKGGFGTVYHGYDGATQVAVKMLSPSSIQGYKELQSEASLLMNIHHKNLTSFVGYCNEGTNMGIIYEYMAKGNLDNLLSGLDYLHHGCKPPIVHRDVKPTNILLSENFQAKLSDFGISRVFPVEGDTHVSTIVVGTPGYLDPEYYTSNRLTEKSDVYGFGIVLLEIVAGRPAVAKTQDNTHIIQWVSATVQKGDIKHIVDPRLREEFDVNSVWKAVELAMACVSRTSTKRPTMNYVVTELKECLAVEIAKRTDSKDSVRLISMNLDSGMDPQAR
ncbi:hypothetical protein LguiB_020539 [Lonicera macranthoides]